MAFVDRRDALDMTVDCLALPVDPVSSFTEILPHDGVVISWPGGTLLWIVESGSPLVQRPWESGG